MHFCRAGEAWPGVIPRWCLFCSELSMTGLRLGKRVGVFFFDTVGVRNFVLYFVLQNRCYATKTSAPCPGDPRVIAARGSADGPACPAKGLLPHARHL